MGEEVRGHREEAHQPGKRGPAFQRARRPRGEEDPGAGGGVEGGRQQPAAAGGERGEGDGQGGELPEAAPRADGQAKSGRDRGRELRDEHPAAEHQDRPDRGRVDPREAQDQEDLRRRRWHLQADGVWRSCRLKTSNHIISSLSSSRGCLKNPKQPKGLYCKYERQRTYHKVKILDPVGSTVRYEMMKLCTGHL